METLYVGFREQMAVVILMSFVLLRRTIKSLFVPQASSNDHTETPTAICVI